MIWLAVPSILLPVPNSAQVYRAASWFTPQATFKYVITHSAKSKVSSKNLELIYTQNSKEEGEGGGETMRQTEKER